MLPTAALRRSRRDRHRRRHDDPRRYAPLALAAAAGAACALALALAACSAPHDAGSRLAGDPAPPEAANPTFGEDPADAAARPRVKTDAESRLDQQIAMLTGALDASTLDIETEDAPVEQAAALPEPDAGARDRRLETRAAANVGPVLTLDDADQKSVPAETVSHDDAPPPLLELPDADADLKPAMPPELSPQEEAQLLVEQLAGALRRAGEQDLSPLPSMAKLALLEVFQPGAFNTQHPLFESAAADADHPLSEDERAFVRAWRDLFTDLHVRFGDQAVDLDAVADSVARLDDAMNRWRPLEITTAALCTQVDGFGVYNPLRTFDRGRYKFLAGRDHPVIVYVELDHFGATPTTADEAPAFQVELTQSLTLFHAGTPRVAASDDLVAWRTEPQRIRDVSRREREDFFVVQIVTLPRSLSVGGYRLKVEMRDAATDSVAETIIPIDVVADVSAFDSGLATVPAND